MLYRVGLHHTQPKLFEGLTLQQLSEEESALNKDGAAPSPARPSPSKLPWVVVTFLLVSTVGTIAIHVPPFSAMLLFPKGQHPLLPSAAQPARAARNVHRLNNASRPLPLHRHLNTSQHPATSRRTSKLDSLHT